MTTIDAPDVAPELRLTPEPDGSTRVALYLGAREASRAFIVPFTLRYGVATVRMDGIGDVATPEDLRFRGYSRRVMEAAVERMRAGAAPVTMLYGIQDFYPKYGYATLGPECVCQIEAGDTPPMPAGWSAHPATLADVPAIMALYDQATDMATGAVVRHPDRGAWAALRGQIDAGQDEVRVAVGPDGAVGGYAWRGSSFWWLRQWENYMPGGLKLAEAFAADAQAADAVLALCAAWTREHDADVVAFGIPDDGPLGLALKLRTCLLIRRPTRAGEFMGRVTGVAPLMRAIQPELQRVWARSDRPFQGGLVIDTGEDAVCLRLTEDSVAVVDGQATDHGPELRAAIAPGELARLVFGGMQPADQLARLGLAPEVIAPLVALFPRRFPYIYPPDRF